MAQDIFAPKSSFNIGYERPVAQPVEDKRGETQAKFQQMANEVQAAQVRAQGQIDRAKLGMANTLLSGLGSAVAGYGQAQAKTKMSGLANDWLDGIQTAQELRDQGKFNEAALAERKVTKQAVASGLDLDKYKTEFEAITGRPMEYVGQTREQQSFEMLKNDQNFQMAYFAAQGKLGPSATEDQVLAQALTSVKQQAIAKDTLALVGAGNQLNWETQVKGAYTTVLDQFDDGIVAGLVSRTQQGQPITPGEIDTVLMQHNLMSQKLIKPAYVTDEQWGEVKDRLELQKEFLTTLKSSRDPDAMLTDMVSQMMQSAETPLDAMAVAAASDPANLSATLGLNIPQIVNTVANSAFTDNNWKKRGQIISDLQQVDVTTPVSANSTFSLETAPSFLQPYINSDKSTMKKNVDAGVAMIGNLKPMEMQNEGTRKQLYNGVMSITAGMLSDKEFYSSSTLSSIFNNPNLKQSLDMVAAVDRESADEMRIAIRSAATMQKTALEANLQSIETNSLVGAVWDEQDKTYYITGDQGKAAQAFGYKGEMTDKGFKLAPTNVTFPEGYKDAVDRRKSLAILNRTLSDLSIEEGEDTTTPAPQMPEGITYDLPEDVQGDTEFLSAVDNTANMLGVTSDQLLAVMDFETIGSFDPAEKSGTSSATGLIQFIESTAGDLGTTTEELAKMTRTEQMVYVNRYLSRFQGRIKNTGDIYMAVHWPRAVGKNDSYVMYRRGSDNYSANQSLDTNNDGTVTRGEALQRLRDVTANKFTDVQRVASEALEAAPSSPRPRLSPSGNVGPRPDDETRAAAWDTLYSGTHDPETGQLIQGE
jgi:hypothetical protein